jgi:hypothetical protein
MFPSTYGRSQEKRDSEQSIFEEVCQPLAARHVGDGDSLSERAGGRLYLACPSKHAKPTTLSSGRQAATMRAFDLTTRFVSLA